MKAKPKAKRAVKRKPAPSVRMKTAKCLGIEEEITDDNPNLTIKQEAFAHAYVETGNASEAYRRAYDTTNWTDKSVWEKASHLLANGKVRARVDLLRADIRERHTYTVDDLVAELEEARNIAKENGNPAPMVAATMGKGKLLGLVVEKNEHTGAGGAPLMTVDPSARDLSRAILDILREAKLEGQPYGPSVIDGMLVDDEYRGDDVVTAPAVANARVVRVYNAAAGRLE